MFGREPQYLWSGGLANWLGLNGNNDTNNRIIAEQQARLAQENAALDASRPANGSYLNYQAPSNATPGFEQRHAEFLKGAQDIRTDLATRETNYQQNYLGNPQQRAWATGFTSPAGPTAPVTAMAAPQIGTQQNGRSFGIGLAPQQPQSAMDAWNAAQQRKMQTGYYAHGGVVGMHPGQPKGTDTVPAWLTPGEAVLNKGAVQMMGKDQIEQMNKQGLSLMPQQKASNKAMMGNYHDGSSEKQAQYHWDGEAAIKEGLQEWEEQKRLNAETQQQIASQQAKARPVQTREDVVRQQAIEQHKAQQVAAKQPSIDNAYSEKAFTESQPPLRVVKPAPRTGSSSAVELNLPKVPAPDPHNVGLGRSFGVQHPVWVGQDTNAPRIETPVQTAGPRVVESEEAYLRRMMPAGQEPAPTPKHTVEYSKLSATTPPQPVKTELSSFKNRTGAVESIPYRVPYTQVPGALETAPSIGPGLGVPEFTPPAAPVSTTDIPAGKFGEMANSGSVGKMSMGDEMRLKGGLGVRTPPPAAEPAPTAPTGPTRVQVEVAKRDYRDRARARGQAPSAPKQAPAADPHTIDYEQVDTPKRQFTTNAAGETVETTNAAPKAQPEVASETTTPRAQTMKEALNAERDAAAQAHRNKLLNPKMPVAVKTGVGLGMGMLAEYVKPYVVGAIDKVAPGYQDMVNKADAKYAAMTDPTARVPERLKIDNAKGVGMSSAVSKPASSNPEVQNDRDVIAATRNVYGSGPKDSPVRWDSMTPQQQQIARGMLDDINAGKAQKPLDTKAVENYFTGNFSDTEKVGGAKGAELDYANKLRAARGLSSISDPADAVGSEAPAAKVDDMPLAPRHPTYAADYYAANPQEMDRYMNLKKVEDQRGRGVSVNAPGLIGSVHYKDGTPEDQERLAQRLRTIQANNMREVEALGNYELETGKKGRISHAGFLGDGNFIITEDDGKPAPDLSEVTLKHHVPGYQGGMSLEDRQAAIQRAGTTIFHGGLRPDGSQPLWTEYPDAVDTGAALELPGYREAQYRRDYAEWAAKHPKEAVEVLKLQILQDAKQKDYELASQSKDVVEGHLIQAAMNGDENALRMLAALKGKGDDGKVSFQQVGTGQLHGKNGSQEFKAPVAFNPDGSVANAGIWARGLFNQRNASALEQAAPEFFNWGMWSDKGDPLNNKGPIDRFFNGANDSEQQSWAHRKAARQTINEAKAAGIPMNALPPDMLEAAGLTKEELAAYQ